MIAVVRSSSREMEKIVYTRIFSPFLSAHLGGPVKLLYRFLFDLFFEKDVVKFYKEHAPYDVSVDIGAGIGVHTRKLARISRKVIAIEPINDLNGVPGNVEVYKVAVGQKREIKEINIIPTELPHKNASFCDPSLTSEKVQVVPLDDIVTEADFLKVDVEGYELEVLESSSILDSVKYVVIELHNPENSPENVVDYQRRIFRLLKDFRVYTPETSFVTEKDIPLSKNYHLLCTRRGI